MNTFRLLIISIVLSGFVTISFPAFAEREFRHNERREHERFRKRHDIRHFDHRDYSVWRSGRWHHGTHDGRIGWWWIVAGTWYFYPRPVYPFPDPYTPPAVIVQPAPSSNMQIEAPPPAQYWYFCPSANSYYPYISHCPEGWQSVPATPPAAPATGNTGKK